MTDVQSISALEQKLLEQIKEKIRADGLSQSKLAAKLGKNRQALNPLFTGKRQLLTPLFEEVLNSLNLELTLQPRKQAQDPKNS